MYNQRLIDISRKRVEETLRVPLIEYSPGQVQDFLQRMRKVEWDEETGNPSRELSEEEQKFITNEIFFSRISFPYWCQRYATVLTDKKRLSPLIPWPSQEKLFKVIADAEIAPYQDEEAKKIKIVLLKSRQVGGTAASEALLAHMAFLNPRTQGIIASDHPDGTQKLWQTLMRMYDNLPGWMRPHRDAKVKATHLHLDRMESDVIAGSGNQKTTLGQGMNVDVAHLTEVSSWLYPNYIDEDLMPAFDSSWKHHSTMILESTGSGAKGNWFHDKFQGAQSGTNRMHPVFIAWYMRPGWRTSDYGVTFSKQTLDMAERVRREVGKRLSREQMAWYQLKRLELESEGKLELFFQEFPSTVEEAFQTGLKSAFPIELRAKIRDACRTPIAVFDVNVATKKLRKVDLEEWTRDPLPNKADGKLLVWEWAHKWPGAVHVVGVDASYGIDGGDSAAVEVLRVGNTRQDDEQVAEWRGSCSPLELAGVCEIIGNVFKERLSNFPAMLAVECNPGSPGLITQTELMRRNYPNFYVWTRPLRADGAFSKEYGWWTTPKTRPMLTETGVEYIKKGYLLVNSPFLVDEMGSFVNVDIDKGQKKLAHAPGHHDDRLIALFIALYVAHERDMRFLAEERRKMSSLREAPQEEVRELQSLGLPWDQAVAQWEKQFGV